MSDVLCMHRQGRSVRKLESIGFDHSQVAALENLGIGAMSDAGSSETISHLLPTYYLRGKVIHCTYTTYTTYYVVDVLV